MDGWYTRSKCKNKLYSKFAVVSVLLYMYYHSYENVLVYCLGFVEEQHIHIRPFIFLIP